MHTSERKTLSKVHIPRATARKKAGARRWPHRGHEHVDIFGDRGGDHGRIFTDDAASKRRQGEVAFVRVRCPREREQSPRTDFDHRFVRHGICLASVLVALACLRSAVLAMHSMPAGAPGAQVSKHHAFSGVHDRVGVQHFRPFHGRRRRRWRVEAPGGLRRSRVRRSGLRSALLRLAEL